MRFILNLSIVFIVGLGLGLFLSQGARFEVDNMSLDNFLTPLSVKHLAFVGDMMFDREVKTEIVAHGGDYNFPLEKIKPVLLSYDFVFGNLEGPVSNRGVNVGSQYSFRMDPETIPALKDAHFKAVSVANNHIGDWGPRALIDTAHGLLGAGILPVGFGENNSDAYTPKIIDVDGLKIALIGASEFGKGYTEAGENYAGIAIIDEGKLVAAVESAKTEADLVVVSLHFGVEYASEPNSYQKSIAHALVDAGADLVVGHHPHVLESLEAYSGGFIVYSLGNFIFDQRFSKETMTSAIFGVTVTNKKITGVQLRPISLNQELQPELSETSSPL